MRMAMPRPRRVEPAAEALHEIFEVGQGGRLVVEASQGSVDVRACAIEVVEIRVTQRGGPRPEVRMEQRGADVHVEARDLAGLGWLPGWARPELRFEVRIPARYSVDIETGRGRVCVADARGRVEIRTDGGSLELRDVAGPIDGRTRGGAIDVASCTGEVHLVSAGGPVRITQVEGAVSAHTAGGRLQVLDTQGALDLHSQGGPVRIAGIQGSVAAGLA